MLHSDIKQKSLFMHGIYLDSIRSYSTYDASGRYRHPKFRLKLQGKCYFYFYSYKKRRKGVRWRFLSTCNGK